ncbi:hypothetical protein RDABS01_012862 [Bienertia sinuspersici]
MVDEITAKCAKLNIEDGETELIDMKEITESQSNEKISLMLIGKLLTERSINIEAFKSTMTKAWEVSGRIIIRVIGPNRYVFQFFHWRDKEKVLMGRLWCFDQNLLVLSEIAGSEQPDEVPLTYSPFWVRICNLPFNCRSDETIHTIASKIGVVTEVEKDDLGLGKFRRARVVLDVTKPLRRFQRIKNKDGRVIKVDYKYERLPFFCFSCGVMGHSEKDCLVSEDEGTNGDYGWGMWLKASPYKGRNREVEELAGLKTSRKVLFVGKKHNVDISESSSSNSRNTPQRINVGNEEDALKEAGMGELCR